MAMDVLKDEITRHLTAMATRSGIQLPLPTPPTIVDPANSDMQEDETGAR